MKEGKAHPRCGFGSHQLLILIAQILQTLCPVPKPCCKLRTSAGGTTALREITIFLQNSEFSSPAALGEPEFDSPTTSTTQILIHKISLCWATKHSLTHPHISSSPLNDKLLTNASKPLGKCSSGAPHHYHGPVSVCLSVISH